MDDQEFEVEKDRIIEQYKLTDSFNKMDEVAINLIVEQVLSKEKGIKTFLQNAERYVVPESLVWCKQVRDEGAAHFRAQYLLCLKNDNSGKLNGSIAYIHVQRYYMHGKEITYYKMMVKTLLSSIEKSNNTWVDIKQVQVDCNGEFRVDESIVFSLAQDAYVELIKLGYTLPEQGEIVFESR